MDIFDAKLESIITIDDIKDFLLTQGYEWLEPRKANFKDLIDKEISVSFSTIDGYQIDRYLKVCNTEIVLFSEYLYVGVDSLLEKENFSLQWQKFLLEKHGEKYAKVLKNALSKRKVQIKLDIEQENKFIEEHEKTISIYKEDLTELDKYEEYASTFISKK